MYIYAYKGSDRIFVLKILVFVTKKKTFLSHEGICILDVDFFFIIS